jgi:hypothetical protein
MQNICVVIIQDYPKTGLKYDAATYVRPTFVRPQHLSDPKWNRTCLFKIPSSNICLSWKEKDQLLEIHLLKKTAQHQISTAQHRLSRCQKKWNCSKIKKVSFRADASFRPKRSTAWIATAQQKHWKMSTARIIKNWKSGTCRAVRLKKLYRKLKVRNMYSSLVIKQSRLG